MHVGASGNEQIRQLHRISPCSDSAAWQSPWHRCKSSVTSCSQKVLACRLGDLEPLYIQDKFLCICKFSITRFHCVCRHSRPCMTVIFMPTATSGTKQKANSSNCSLTKTLFYPWSSQSCLQWGYFSALPENFGSNLSLIYQFIQACFSGKTLACIPEHIFLTGYSCCIGHVSSVSWWLKPKMERCIM